MERSADLRALAIGEGFALPINDFLSYCPNLRKLSLADPKSPGAKSLPPDIESLEIRSNAL